VIETTLNQYEMDNLNICI